MSTVYLHIGTPKTGTSAIQYFMAGNRKLLESKGYCYPDLGMSFPGIGYNRNAHFLVQKIYDEKKNRLVGKEEELVAKGLDKISEIAKRFSNIIISDEGIWNGGGAKEEFWKNLERQLEDRKIDLKIIVYLRRQDLFIQSYWAQLVKETWTLSFDEYISNGRYKNCALDYSAYLNRIANVIGKDNIIVRVYEKQQYRGTNNSIISDFLEAINLQLTDEYQNMDKVYNVSLSGSPLEVKRILNHMPEYKNKFNFIVPLLAEVQTEMLQNVGFKECKYFSYDEQLKFLEQYAEGNSSVARDYLKRENGILFMNTIEANDSKKISLYSTEELVFVCGKIIALQQHKLDEMIEKSKKNQGYLIEAEKKLRETQKKLKNAEERILLKIGKNIKRYLMRKH
ncbi:hypothetical protein [Clostridium oryzae]|uniref:Sulfotransferase domain protein n=1 Tax=Clostridium oryzae TaxID=1450648 RepID=A0A1V4IN14_9CLOT|nr:hypothetical protein [Clostridium oryzae]OPJ61431.1 hypothetical protein CLORY_22970 [Clostridium oryzae]